MIDAAQRKSVHPHLSNLLHHPAEILDESAASAIRLNIRPIHPYWHFLHSADLHICLK